MTLKKLCLTFVLLLCLGLAFGLDADLKSVDVTVVLRPDGKADIHYKLEWYVSSGAMTGFYFEGEAFEPIWNLEHCYADLENNVRVPLTIDRKSDGRSGTGRFDVYLKDKKTYSGKAYYFLHYAGDFAAQGLVGKTLSPEHGNLTYFNWGPVWWDEAIEYRSVRLVLPVQVSGEQLGDDEKKAIPILTEKFVNVKNKIDYYGSKGDDGRYYLSILFYDDDVAAKDSHRLTLYFPENYVSFSSEFLNADGYKPKGQNLASLGSKDQKIELLVVLFIVIVISALLYFLRATSYKKKVKRMASIVWAGNDWTPPKLFAGTYQVAGKVIKTLNPVEVALLLELSLPRIVSIMLDGLVIQGIIKVIEEDPLKISFIAEKKASSEIEELFLACFDAEGNVLPGLLADFFEDAIKKLQEKAWDADIEATKSFYREKILESEKESATIASMDETQRRDYYSTHRELLYWHSYAMVASRPVLGIKLGEGLNGTYSDFMRSASCYSGCFTPSNTGSVDACYSACHNACHDACHSACHDACHSACHDACHSACVSGGAH